MGPVRAAWGRGKVAWGGVGLSRVEYHGTHAQASLGRVGPVRARGAEVRLRGAEWG